MRSQTTPRACNFQEFVYSHTAWRLLDGSPHLSATAARRPDAMNILLCALADGTAAAATRAFAEGDPALFRAADASEALTVMGDQRPSLVILGGESKQAPAASCRLLRAAETCSDAVIVALGSERPDNVRDLIEAGADDFFLEASGEDATARDCSGWPFNWCASRDSTGTSRWSISAGPRRSGGRPTSSCPSLASSSCTPPTVSARWRPRRDWKGGTPSSGSSTGTEARMARTARSSGTPTRSSNAGSSILPFATSPRPERRLQRFGISPRASQPLSTASATASSPRTSRARSFA